MIDGGGGGEANVMRWVSPGLAVLMGTAKQCVKLFIYLKMLRVVHIFMRVT